MTNSSPLSCSVLRRSVRRTNSPSSSSGANGRRGTATSRTSPAGRAASQADDAPRLVHLVVHVLAERPELLVVVLIEHAFDRYDPLPTQLITGMTELAVALPNVHVVLTADHPDSVPETNRASCAALAWLEPSGDGTMRFGDRSVPFVGITTETHAGDVVPPTDFDAPRLIVRPTTHGTCDDTTRTATQPGDRRRRDRCRRRPRGRGRRSRREHPARRRPQRCGGTSVAAPTAASHRVDAAALLARHTGDGVPIGLVDRPELAENEAYWWQPGSGGSLLAAGSPGQA